MRGSEVLKCLERGGKIRLKDWQKDLYISGTEPPYIRNPWGDDSMVSSISQLYDYDWEEYIPPKKENQILSYEEALSQLNAGDRVKIVNDGSTSGFSWCTDGTYTGIISNRVTTRINGDDKSLLVIRLDKYPTQFWGLGKNCKVQKVD